MLDKIKNLYGKFGRYLGAMKVAPSKAQMQTCLLVLGVMLLTAGIGMEAMAAPAASGSFDSTRLDAAILTIVNALEGSFGALVCVIAGLFAIVMAAMGQYKVAMSLLVVSLGAFILRSIVKTFFNTGTAGI